MEHDGTLSDAEITEAVARIERSEDASDEERTFYLEFLAEYCSGAVAEDGVRRLVPLLGKESLESMVRKHVVAWHAPPGTVYCRDPKTVASRLADHGFSPVRNDGAGWTVGWGDGEVLAGEELCPIALLAVWLRRMQQRVRSVTEELEG